MSISNRLRNPTLVPTDNDGDFAACACIEQPNKLREENSLQSPQISHQTSRASTVIKPTYHNIIEEKAQFLIEAIKPFVKEIVNEDKQTINEYSLVSSIGHGQFGKVYKAYAKNDNILVAIKMISKKPWNNQQYSMNQTMKQIQLWRSRGMSFSITNDEAVRIMNVQKCRWEVYVLSRLTSPHVVSLKECLDSSLSKSIWIVSEYCNLGELQWKRGNLKEALPQWQMFLPGCNHITFAERALLDLTKGLFYLKSQGCIHRDIKPSNILVDSNFNALKISDFGCTILTPSVLPFNDVILRGSFKAELNKIVGTPAFIAPELCHFEENLNDIVEDGFKLDMWALGVTIFSLLYNEMPFFGDNEFDLYHKAKNTSLHTKINGQFLNDLVITKLLDKNPETRIDVEELYKIILPKYRHLDNTYEENKINNKTKKKTVRKFFNKIWNGKFNKNEKPLQDHNEVVHSPITQNFDTPMGPSHYIDPQEYPIDLISSSSSYEEPVQVTQFMEPSQEQTIAEHKDRFGIETEEVTPKNKTSRIQSCSTGEMSESVSLLSISPIKIPTPIKALIRIKSSPRGNKTNNKINNISPLKDKQKKRGGNAKLAHSSDIINFQKYIHPKSRNDKLTKEKPITSTKEDIQEYLRYADNA